jgi:hypothetical protein
VIDQVPNPASAQLRHEIWNLCINRYGHESDITVWDTIGVLEIVKFDLIEALNQRDKDL